MIETIELTNWRSHSNTRLQFKEGTNLVIGIMGSGKSSVMDGLSFGLFGTFPSLESRRLKIGDLFRYGSDELRVSLEFGWNGKQYRIERKVNKKGKSHSAEAVLYEGEKLIERGNRAVSQYIEQLLGIDYALFTRAIYSEQNSIDYFLNLNPKKRKEEFDRLLGLDKFESVRGNLTALINRIKRKLNELEKEYDKEKLETHKKEVGKNREKLGKIGADKRGKEKTKEKLMNEINELRDGIKVILDKKNKYEELREREVKISALIAEYKEQVKGIDVWKSIGEMEEKYKTDKKKSEGLKIKINELEEEQLVNNRELNLIENNLERKNNLEKELKGIKDVEDGKIKKIEEDIIKTREMLEKNKLEYGTKRNRIEEMEEIIKNIKSYDGHCPLCESEMDRDKANEIQKRKKREIEFIKKEMGNIAGKIKDNENKLEKLKKENKLLQEREEKKNYIKNEISGIKIDKKKYLKEKEKFKEIKNNLEKFKNNKENIDEIVSKLYSEINEAKKAKEIYKKLKEYEELIPVIKKDKEELGFDQKELEKKKEEWEKFRIEFEGLKNSIESLGKEEKYIKTIIKNNEEIISSIEKIEGKMGIIGKMEEELIIYKNVIKEVQISLRDQLIESINIAMNEIWEIFYPYKDYTKIRLKITERDYVFEVYDGEWKGLEGVVSGGERACVALTLRVALSTVLTPNVSWLVLDEPTHNLDREAIGLLSETLQTKVPEIIKQIFVITHEELLAGANFSSSYRLKRNKEIGEPTQAEAL